MAYVDLGIAAHRPDSASREGDSEAARLGRDEWSVVEIARKDGLWSLNPDGLPQRLVRALFGIRPPRPLANERLEAVRRVAVLAWNKGALRANHLREFIAAGYSCADARLILDHVLRRRKIQSWPRGIA